MRYALLAAAAACVCCTLTVSAARPFERLDSADPALLALAAAESAGLLAELSVPEGGLSRLEAAVLTQRALNAYGSLLADGGTADEAAEQALASLAETFAAELEQLGYHAGPPNPDPLTQSASLNARLDRIEKVIEAPQEAGAEEPQNTAYDTYLCPDCTVAETPSAASAVDVKLVGDIYTQASWYGSDGNPGTTEMSDVNIYWGEIGAQVTSGPWSGLFTMSLNDEANTIDLHEAWGMYKNPQEGWFVQAGRIELPFSYNYSRFPTWTMPDFLGYTRARALAAGWDKPDWALRAYLFNPQVESVDGDDVLSEVSVVWDVARQRATDCEDGYQLVAGYTTFLPQHDIRFAGNGPIESDVAAYNLFGAYDWGGNTWHFSVDYTAALDQFVPAELDANQDGVGDQPSALSFQLVHEPRPDELYGLILQSSDEMAGFAQTRYGALYGERLSEIAVLKFEYTHGEFDAFARNGESSDDTFVTELNIAF
jgi:hypothetical protein